MKNRINSPWSLSVAKGLVITSILLIFTACSSAPKRSMQVSTIYSTAYEMIESANACILSGDYDKAGFFLSAAENQAMSIDNYDLLTDASLARCSLSLSVNPPDIETAERYVGFAQGFVKNCVNPKKQQALVALNEVRIETAKGNLDENANISCVTSAFDSNYMNVVKVMFRRDLALTLWGMLFIIPGIYKAYEYRMIPYLLAENPNLSWKEAFSISKEMMNGNKWKAFVLDLSFIGWNLLSILTLGILSIFYVNPYKFSTNAALYEQLKYRNVDTPEVITA